MGCADALIFLETEEADILTVGFFFFAVESGQTFALGGQARLEAAAGSTGGSLCFVSAHRGDFFVYFVGDVDDGIVGLLRTHRPIIEVLDRVRLHAASQLLGIVSAHAGHPARGLNGLAGNGVVGVFLPVAPGVEGGDCIYFDIRTLHGGLNTVIPKKDVHRYTLRMAKENSKIIYRGDWAREERVIMEDNGYKNGDDLSGKMFPTLFETS